VFIEGLEVDTVIGAYDWEREIRQCLRLDLSFAWDNRKPAANDDLSLAQCAAYWGSLIQRVWLSLEKKRLQARGVTVKLKLKNFQVLQHSRSFKQALSSQQEMTQAVQLLLKEMQIPAQDQFRLIGVGLYQLAEQQDEAQLLLW